MLKIEPMKVVIKGPSARPPEKITVPRGANLVKEITKILDTFAAQDVMIGTALISTQTGSGKTYAMLHGVLPWARERDLQTLYVSSRVAINTQFKDELVEETGQHHLKDELTRIGMRNRSEFDGIDVITYHKLLSQLQYDKDSMKHYDILIFDEIHALLDDSMFVGGTGQLLKHLKDFCCTSIRLYLSATPEAILPYLPWAPYTYPSKILHMPRNYAYIVPHFFANEEELQKCINADTSNKKWLIFMPHISDARRFSKGLIHPYCMLNGEEREVNPDKWYKVLENECFEEKVCLVTAIIDAGVNFKDPALVNIAIFSTNPNTYKQVLGRKRRSSSDEKVHLYAWCPMPEEINKLKFRNTAMREAIDSFEERKAQFIQKYILQPQEFDLRSLMAVSPEGEMEPNHLARIYLQNEFDLFEKIQLYAKEHKDPACFDVFVTRWLGIPLPDRADSWLDGRFSGEARLEFDSFLNEYFGVILDEEGFLEFSREFQHKCINAYGKASNGRDRDDRIWKEKKINNKFEELELPYRIDCNNLDKTYCLLKRKVV